MAQPFRSLLDEDFLDRLAREWDYPTPERAEGTNIDEMVGRRGLELLTPCASCRLNPFAAGRRRSPKRLYQDF